MTTYVQCNYQRKVLRKRLDKRLKRKLRQREQDQQPEPRYDDVYVRGVEWMNERG